MILHTFFVHCDTILYHDFGMYSMVYFETVLYNMVLYYVSFERMMHYMILQYVILFHMIGYHIVYYILSYDMILYNKILVYMINH